VEALESRELMTYTPLGAALPDLTISGYASSTVSWAQPVTVNVTLQNLGTSTVTEPLALEPGSTSSADAPESVVGVYVTHGPRFNGFVATRVGQFNVPALTQNNLEQVSATFIMPNRLPGYPGDGGHLYIWFVANVNKSFPETDFTNNVSNGSRALIEAPLPELIATGLSVPPVMQPGDTIQPTIRVTNIGPADTSPQGPITVALVASVNRSFGPGSEIIAQYQVPNIPGINQTASKSLITTDANLEPAGNTVTIFGSPVKLPASSSGYFLGVVVDPSGNIKQLQIIGHTRTARSVFQAVHRVGGPIRGLPPAGSGTSGVEVPNPVFPFPITGIPVGTNPNGVNSTGLAGGTQGTLH
jgi:hypothetical protein